MFIPTGKSVGIKIEEYKGKYSLVSAYNKDGDIKLKWCKIKEYDRETKEQKEVERPVKIYLGDAATALEVVRAIMAFIEKAEIPADTSDSIPF
jgi:hypothetical protein